MTRRAVKVSKSVARTRVEKRMVLEGRPLGSFLFLRKRDGIALENLRERLVPLDIEDHAFRSGTVERQLQCDTATITMRQTEVSGVKEERHPLPGPRGGLGGGVRSQAPPRGPGGARQARQGPLTLRATPTSPT